MKKILVTGGAGYIGSHTVIHLLNEGYFVTIVDNFSNSSYKALSSIKKITNKSPVFYEVDILNRLKLNEIMDKEQFDAVIHFAAYKSIPESISFPEKYYQNNIVGTLNLLSAMDEFDIRNLIFSSSATVYGNQECKRIEESTPTIMPDNPYGKSKLIIENIINDISFSDSKISAINLRYFNPVGAHESGLWGENPINQPSNLMPILSEVAIGVREKFSVFGNDYNTYDGTGVRDYIHISDLASGHVAALSKCLSFNGCLNINLGSGIGYSVLDMVSEFSKACGMNIPYQIDERRDGDVAYSVADISKAKEILNWTPQKTIKDMCEDEWRWRKNILRIPPNN